MNRTLIIVSILFLLSGAIHAQTFSSGSTGADGALDLSSGNREIQLPENGILNFTTVNIPSGKVLSFKPNTRNTSVLMLAQGNVTIAGRVSVDALFRRPGNGGFYGGETNKAGYGPGGGTIGSPGIWTGPLSLVPNIGGSGGGGNSFGAGGGGGGAITIASSTSITLLPGSLITADAGQPGSGLNHGGAGGAIRLVANVVNVSGELVARGSTGAGQGIIRLEGGQGTLSFTGSAVPSPILSAINPAIAPVASSPALSILSIGNYPVPSDTAARPDAVDLMLPRQLTDPIPVVVRGSNIPVGTQVRINISGGGSPTATTATLAGTLQSSSATINISGLDKGGGITYLYVYATFDLPQTSQSFNRKGKDEIAQVRVEAAPGARPKYIFLRKDGSAIEKSKVPAELLAQYGGLEE